MGVELNIRDVFEIAEQIEKEAGAFFRRAAGAASSPAARRALLELATMEAEHEQVFSALKTRMHAAGPGSAFVPPPENIGRELPFLARSIARNVQEDLAGSFAGGGFTKEILQRALDFDIGAVNRIAFYLLNCADALDTFSN